MGERSYVIKSSALRNKLNLPKSRTLKKKGFVKYINSPKIASTGLTQTQIK